MKRFIAGSIFIFILALATLVVFHFALDAYAETCKAANHAQNKDCTRYNLVLLTFGHIAKFLNDYGVAITAIATIVISLFTWFLVDSTDRLWKAGDVQIDVARVSANAANRSAKVAEDTLAETIRPYLKIQPHFDAILSESDDGLRIAISMRIYVENVGTAPATNIIELSRLIKHGDKALENDFAWNPSLVIERHAISAENALKYGLGRTVFPKDADRGEHFIGSVTFADASRELFVIHLTCGVSYRAPFGAKTRHTFQQYLVKINRNPPPDGSEKYELGAIYAD